MFCCLVVHACLDVMVLVVMVVMGNLLEEVALVAVGLGELLVEMRVGLAESLRLLYETDEDRSHTGVDDFDDDEGDRKADDEANEGECVLGSLTALDKSDNASNRSSEKSAHHASGVQHHAGDIVVEDCIEPMAREHIPGGLG